MRVRGIAMAKQQEFYVNIDMQGHQLVNAKAETVTSKPAFVAAEAGRVVFVSTGDDKGFWYNDGTAWVAAANAADVAALKTAVGDASDPALLTGSLYARIAKNAADISTISENLGLGGSTGSGESVTDRVVTLENAVGTASDEASDTGSLYARVKKNASGVTANATAAANAQSTADTAKSTADTAKSTAEANTAAIGSSSDTSDKSTVYGAIKKNAEDIAALQSAVGADADGLAAKVAANTTAIAEVKATADAAAVKTDVDTALANKVDKAEGKSLVADTEITKLSGVAAGAQVNVIEAVKVNNTALDITEKAVNIDLSSYALKSDVTSAVSSAYIFKGTKTFAELATAEKVAGYVYNVSDSFQEDGKNYPAGTNVAWNGTAWDALAGYIDTSVFAQKTDVETALAGKEDTLTGAKLEAVNSGITTAKVATYDGYQALIDSKVTAEAAKPTAGTYTKVTVAASGLVTAGAALTAEDIPALDAAKTTTGTFDAARIPTLDISAKTSGTLAADRLGIVFETVSLTTNAGAETAVTFTNISGAPYMAVVTKANGEQIGCSVIYTSNGLTIETGEAVAVIVRAFGVRKA